MSNCAEVIYQTYNNPNTIQISKTVDGVTTNMDFSAVTRMKILFDGPTKTVVADTAVDSALIDYSAGSGKVTFAFNDLNLSTGRYKATLIAYDPSHTDGQILLHKDTHKLRFNIV